MTVTEVRSEESGLVAYLLGLWLVAHRVGLSRGLVGRPVGVRSIIIYF